MQRAEVAVLIPVLSRPSRVQPLVEALRACSPDVPCRPYFLVSPGDAAEEEAVRASGANLIKVTWPPGRGDYARKMNHGFAHTDELYVFLGADDLRFDPDWAVEAIAVQQETGACVVGTNDLGNPRVVSGEHSTHTLVHRGYGDCGTIDDPTRILHEHYHHQFVDDELVQTALSRDTYAHAHDAHVEHLHPNWGKAADDSTYRRGNRHFWADRNLFLQREKLWT